MRSILVVWIRSSLVVRASDCQCRSRNSTGFDPSGIWGAADEAVLNTVHRKNLNELLGILSALTFYEENKYFYFNDVLPAVHITYNTYITCLNSVVVCSVCCACCKEHVQININAKILKENLRCLMGKWPWCQANTRKYTVIFSLN